MNGENISGSELHPWHRSSVTAPTQQAPEQPEERMPACIRFRRLRLELLKIEHDEELYQQFDATWREMVDMERARKLIEEGL